MHNQALNDAEANADKVYSDTKPDGFWLPWEIRVSSYEELLERIHRIYEKFDNKNCTFAWRGQSDASWPLYSSLYRLLVEKSKTKGLPLPLESNLQDIEKTILKEFHRWGLHMGEYGRLSILHQLAILQHYGAPTRLIDVTFNPWIAVWFAVRGLKGCDARVFSFNVTHCLLSEVDEEHRLWEDNCHFPWPRPAAKSDNGYSEFIDWCTSLYAWKPPHFHKRLAAQNGGFLLSGVPTSYPGKMVWPKGPDSPNKNWRTGEIREATSIAVRPHYLNSKRPPNTVATYSIRISANAVSDIKRKLERLHGYSDATLFPDYSGFAEYRLSGRV